MGDQAQTPLVDVYDPDGNKGKIPVDNLQTALQRGFKMAVRVTSPEGQGGWLPNDMMGEAMKRGFKVGPPNQQSILKDQDSSIELNDMRAYEAVHGPGSWEKRQIKGYTGSDTAENLAGYIETGPGDVGRGVVDVAKGNIAKGGHEIISGAGTTLAPTVPFAAAGAPVRFGLTAATAYGGGKAAKYGAAALGANPEQQQFAEDLGNVGGGMLAGPAADVIKRGLLLGKTPAEAYASALKPSTTIPQGTRDAIVNTGLQEQIPVSKSGLEKLSGLIDDVNQKISDTIAADPNRPINPAAAVKNLKDVRQRFATQVNPKADLQAIDDSGQEFLDQFRSQPGGAVRNMTAAEAQAMKQGTYRALGDKAYGELKGASIEAQKALARGIKDELAQQFPELSNLNARDGRLLDLQDVLERAVSRIGNHQLMGIGTPAVAGAARAVTGSNKLAAVAGVVKAVLDNPEVKSRLAISIAKAGTPLPIAGQRVNQYIASLATAANFKSDADEQNKFNDYVQNVGAPSAAK